MDTNFLPLFPLNLVVFPEEKLKLHVFEPRYKQLIYECDKQQTTFGIPVYIDGKVKEFGTEMRLISIEKVYQNGELDVVTKGIRPFRLKNFQRITEGKLYPSAEVMYQKNIEDDDLAARIMIIEQLTLLYEALKVKEFVKADFYSFEVAHNIGFSLEQEYELLQLKKESERLQNILTHLKDIVPVVIRTEEIKAKVQMNGYFKNFNKLDL
ncbi:MAG: LON peptidase substrate-binding domain-containing protein [Chitinophagales bacterium]